MKSVAHVLALGIALVSIGGCIRVGGHAGAKGAATRADEATLTSALRNFRADCDRYPTKLEGLRALSMMPAGLEKKWKGPYLMKPVLTDPWGNPYLFDTPALGGKKDTFSLTSYGSDGAPGGDGEAADIIQDGP